MLKNRQGRFMCIILNENLKLDYKRYFLDLGDKIQVCERSTNSLFRQLIFIELNPYHYKNFRREQQAMEHANQKVKSLASDYSIAISDTHPGAQVFSTYNSGFICPSGKEFENINSCPLHYLLDYEGLLPWPDKKGLQKFISYSQIIGCKTVSSISHLNLSTFANRWGKTGELLWMRLNQIENQKIVSDEQTQFIGHITRLITPTLLLSIIIYNIEKSLKTFMEQIKYVNFFPTNLFLRLISKQGDTSKSSIELFLPMQNLKQEQIINLIEDQLMKANLRSPIEEFELRMDIKKTYSALRPNDKLFFAPITHAV